MHRLFFLAALLSVPAAAQEDDVPADESGAVVTIDATRRASNAQKVVIPEVQEIEFEGLRVEGTFVGPDGVLFRGEAERHHGSFIKLRTDFNAELEASTRTIR